MAGYSDSEGCWEIYPQKRRIRVSWVVETSDLDLVQIIADRLRSEGFHPHLYLAWAKSNGRGKAKGERAAKKKLRLVHCKTDEVVVLARIMMQYSKHAEKMERMRLIVSHPLGEWSEIAAEVRRLRKMTKQQVAGYVREAERAYKRRTNTNQHGVVG